MGVSVFLLITVQGEPYTTFYIYSSVAIANLKKLLMAQHHLIQALALALFIGNSHQFYTNHVFATFPELAHQGYRIEDIKTLQQDAQDALLEKMAEHILTLYPFSMSQEGRDMVDEKVDKLASRISDLQELEPNDLEKRVPMDTSDSDPEDPRAMMFLRQTKPKATKPMINRFMMRFKKLAPHTGPALLSRVSRPDPTAPTAVQTWHAVNSMNDSGPLTDFTSIKDNVKDDQINSFHPRYFRSAPSSQHLARILRSPPASPQWVRMARSEYSGRRSCLADPLSCFR